CAGRALTPPAALVAVAAAMRDARDTGLTRRRGRYNRRFSRSAGLSWSSGARVGVPAMHRAPAAGPGTARLFLRRASTIFDPLRARAVASHKA
ncbi:hypothetical protein, partial [Burkholderia sp. HMSC10F09]|uniref:hypothetical protein n=1 Tax=Burkholderia sp. HMSC10F09 TaxID=1581083 RepID=UPI001C401F35